MSCGQWAPVTPHLPKDQEIDVSMQNLGKVSKTMSRMNILIVQKLSIIVAEYFNLINKVQEYCQQIQTLVHYNKKLIQVLKLFEQQQKSLLTRLRTLEQFSLQYLRTYSTMKGIEFKAQEVPQHSSIFFSFNLQQLQYKGESPVVPPSLDPDYKKEVMQIIQQHFLTNQDNLLSKVQNKLTSSNEKQKQQLNQIKDMILQYNKLMNSKQQIINGIKSYQYSDSLAEITLQGGCAGERDSQDGNASVENGTGLRPKIVVNVKEIKDNGQIKDIKEKEEKRFFELLRIRAQIRKKVEQFYDRNTTSDIKPDYHDENAFINKIITLHAKMEEMDEGAITDFLNAEKNDRVVIQKQRVQIQEKIEQKCIEFEKKVQEKEKNIQQLKNFNEQLQHQIVKIKEQKQTETKKLEYFHQQQIQKLEMKTLQLQKQIISLKQKPIMIEASTQSKDLIQLKHQVFNIMQINRSTDFQVINQLNAKIDALQQQIAIVQSDKMEKQKKILQIEQEYEQMKITKEKNIQQLTQQLKSLQQQVEKNETHRKFVEALSIQLVYAINLACRLQINGKVKEKLQSIHKKLQQDIKKYQKELNWNIQKDSPDFFSQFSLRTNHSVQNVEHVDISEDEKMGYSFDISNVKLIQQRMAKKKPGQLMFHHSFIEERPKQLILGNLQFKQESIKSQKGPKSKDLSLNISNEMEDRVDKQQYESLYKNYIRSVQCLAMEEKKTKNLEIDYQKFVERIKRKEAEDPVGYSLQKQLVYLMRLTMEQQDTIETERKQYNQIFKQYQEEFKSKLSDSLNSLKGGSMRVQSEH